MTLSIFYKQFSGNDSFETPEDRQSIYLDKLESEHPGIFCTMESAIFGSFNDFMQLRYYSLILVML